jgi:ABC-type nitrate/sulfonate/bicarbonate transport system substrate-binding protein
MKRLFPRPLLVAVLCALLPLVAGARGASSQTPVTLRVGEVGEPLALVAGIDRGYFAAEGLALTLVPLSGGPALISATIGGSTDINYGDVFAWAAAVANGFNVQMFQASNGAEPPNSRGGQVTLLVNPASGIKTAADLRGKQIGVAPTQLIALEIKLFLQRRGVDPNSVKLVPVTPYLAMGAALKGGHVDAVADSDPYTQQAEKQFGAVAIGVPSHEVAAGASTAGYFATSAWLAAHGDIARRFATAYRRAAKWANTASPEEKGQTLARFSPVNLAALETEIPGIVRDFHYQLYNDGPLNLTQTQEWLDLAVKNGVLDKSIQIKDHLYPTALATRL